LLAKDDMTKEHKIRNPSVTLYPFHLRDDFDEGFQKVAKNAQDLWEKLADDVGTEFNIAELKSLRKHLICYQNEKYNPAGENGQQNYPGLIPPDGKTLDFQPVSQPDNLQLNGSIYPLRIHDTYAADLTLYYQNLTIPVAKLKLFNPSGCLLSNKIQTSLGQTVLLYAEPVIDEDYRTLADECVKAFVQDKIQPAPKFIAEGQLFGSPIFEYDNRNLNPAKRGHILVWLKRHPDTLNLITKTFNFYLLNLLGSRAKIIFSYQKSREWYQEGKRLTSDIEKEVPEFDKIENEPNAELRLEQLKKLLARLRTKVFDYSCCLRSLRECRNTLIINTENYGEALEDIQRLSLKDDNLEFWQKFLDLAENKYQQQIQVDLDYLFPSQDLFQQMISTIRGMVEIEQIESDKRWQAEEKSREDREKERDRRLQDLIFFVGTAIAAGGLFCSSYPLTKDTPIKWLPDLSLPVHPFVWSIVWSIIFGIAFGGLVLGFLVLLRKWLN
jgi:hypothetical protein